MGCIHYTTEQPGPAFCKLFLTTCRYKKKLMWYQFPNNPYRPLRGYYALYCCENILLLNDKDNPTKSTRKSFPFLVHQKKKKILSH